MGGYQRVYSISWFSSPQGGACRTLPNGFRHLLSVSDKPWGRWVQTHDFRAALFGCLFKFSFFHSRTLVSIIISVVKKHRVFYELLFNHRNPGKMHQPHSEDGPFGPIVNGTMVVVFYQYRPNREAGYAFMVLFAIATLAHLVYLIRLKAWMFIPFLMGGLGKNEQFSISLCFSAKSNTKS